MFVRDWWLSQDFNQVGSLVECIVAKFSEIRIFHIPIKFDENAKFEYLVGRH